MLVTFDIPSTVKGLPPPPDVNPLIDTVPPVELNNSNVVVPELYVPPVMAGYEPGKTLHVAPLQGAL
jgi:hypothetical protein